MLPGQLADGPPRLRTRQISPGRAQTRHGKSVNRDWSARTLHRLLPTAAPTPPCTKGEQTMRTLFLTLVLTALILPLAGCATSFHAGGRKVGVDAGAAVG